MGNRLSQLLDALELSRQTMKSVKQNLWWAFGYNIVGIPIAARVAALPLTGTMLTPSMAGALMGVSSLGVMMTNSLLLRALARINIKPNHEAATVAGVFVKPLLEAMGDRRKAVQSGAAMCMAKMVESAAAPPLTAFQKICPRIYKLLISPSFLAKASLLRLVSSLSQVGCISDLEPLLESIHHCLASRDWETRKAAADTLTALASHSSSLIKDTTEITLALLANACSDQIPAVRESVTEALRLWKKIEVGDSKISSLGSDNLSGVKRCYSTLSTAPPKEQGMVKMEASDASFSQSLERRHSGSTLNHLGSSNRIQADDYGFPVNSKSQSQGGTFGGNDALVLPPAADVSNTNNQSEGSLAALRRQLEQIEKKRTHLQISEMLILDQIKTSGSTAPPPPKEQGMVKMEASVTSFSQSLERRHSGSTLNHLGSSGLGSSNHLGSSGLGLGNDALVLPPAADVSNTNNQSEGSLAALQRQLEQIEKKRTHLQISEMLILDQIKTSGSTAPPPPKEQGMVKMEASVTSFSQSLERRHSGSTLNHLGSSGLGSSNHLGSSGLGLGNDALVLPPAADVSNTNNQSEGSLAALQRQLEQIEKQRTHLQISEMLILDQIKTSGSTAPPPPKEQGMVKMEASVTSFSQSLERRHSGSTLNHLGSSGLGSSNHLGSSGLGLGNDALVLPPAADVSNTNNQSEGSLAALQRQLEQIEKQRTHLQISEMLILDQIKTSGSTAPPPPKEQGMVKMEASVTSFSQSLERRHSGSTLNHLGSSGLGSSNHLGSSGLGLGNDALVLPPAADVSNTNNQSEGSLAALQRQLEQIEKQRTHLQISEMLILDQIKTSGSTAPPPPEEQGMVKMEASVTSFSQSLERRHSGSTLNHLGSSGLGLGNDALVLLPAAAVSNTNNQSEGSLAALQRQLEQLGSDNLSGVKRCYSTLSTAPPKEQGVFETRGGGGVLPRFRTKEEAAARYNFIHKTQLSWSEIQRRGNRRTLWAHSLKACTEGDLNLAYSRALSFNDRELLIRLMKHTGPVFDRVSGETRQRILTFISQLLDDQICLDICVTWLQQTQQCPRCATR